MIGEALGIDIGGSGIKFGRVDLTRGELIGERIKVDTPQPSTPEAVAAVIADTLKEIGWTGKRIGVGFPAIIQDGISLSAANIAHVRDAVSAFMDIRGYGPVKDEAVADVRERISQIRSRIA